MFKMYKSERAITLIALVVTIIVLIILAGVSINLVLGDNGIIEKAKEAKFKQERATVIDNAKLGLVEKQLDDINGSISLTDAQIEGVLSKYGTVNKNEDGSIKSITPEGKDYEIPLSEIWDGTIVEAFDRTKKVNVPVLVSGMTPIKFTMPTEESMGEVVKTNTSDAEWYNYGETYETRKWANAQTEDGSMWVWIPRYAYKIDSENQTIDVKFLIGQTDNYYNEDGTIGTAQRQTEVEQTIDTTLDYTVHPAFTDESKINFANGGWDSELTGIWVAKFEAGYASGNNNAPVVASNVNYTQTTAWVVNIEAGTNNSNGGAKISVRNWLDGIYAVKNEDDTYDWKNGEKTSIKYPVFRPLTYSMNYINQNDSYNISKVLTDKGNIYGFSNANANSHMMKNSEWGAVAYLSQSKYGQDGNEIKVNNINLNSGNRQRVEENGKTEIDSVYGITGCSSNDTNIMSNIVTIEDLKETTGNISVTGNNGVAYKWNQLNGEGASTTGTIYGIYDMSGGVWERVTSYVANGNDSLKMYGETLTYQNDILKTKSTEYVTVYPYSAPESTTINTASQTNFKNNSKIYGDSIRETTSNKAGTSESGWDVSSWNDDRSIFIALNNPFFMRGGAYSNGSKAGVFSYYRDNGNSSYNIGFRAVIVPTI